MKAAHYTNDVSIHAPREGSDRIFRRPLRPIFVSIHAPREGSDVEFLSVVRVSIHAPREGSDLLDFGFVSSASAFQSTLPVKGATFAKRGVCPAHEFQSTLPVKGATGCPARRTRRRRCFNPRSP